MTGVVRLHETGGPEALRYESETVGEPGTGQIRLRQEAIGLNFVDTYFRTGKFPAGPLPAVLGVEGAGVVDAVGPGVADVSVGDRVGYYFALGAYAETRLLNASDAIPLPDDMSFVDVAALLAKGLTAWGRLRSVKPGEVVLVTGATGGVGSLVATWAQHLGATVITPVSSRERVAAAEALGLKHVVVAGTGELADAVKSLGPVDVFYDLVGQATFAEAVSVLRDSATVDLVGSASGDPVVDATALAARGIHPVGGPAATHLPDRKTLLTAAGEVFQAWRDGVFGDRRVHTYPLASTAAAHHDLEAGVTGAAVVLIP